MDIKKRAQNIIFSPQKEWEAIKKENISVSDMFSKYAMILAAIPAIANLIGKSIVGIYGFGYTYRVPFGKGIVTSLLFYIMILVGVYAIGFIIDSLAPSFGSKKDSVASFKVAIFASTASWVGGIFYIIPRLSILAGIAGLYSLYLLYLGLKSLKAVPSEKVSGYFIVVIILSILIYTIIGFIAGTTAIGSYAFQSLTGL